MPKGLTPNEELAWNKAKGIATTEGKHDNFAYVMGIFNKIRGKKKRPLKARAQAAAALAGKYGSMAGTGDTNEGDSKE